MSANQKPVPQRYQGSTYPSQRSTTPHRTEGYHVATPQSFVQPPSQPNNQVPSLRMPPAGPPTQSSTPPNSDLKVQSMTQQPPMNLTYVSQTTRGAPSQNFYSRQQQQTTQNPRMANHRPGQQPIFSSTSSTFLPVQTLQHPTVYINSAAPYYGGPRTQGYIPGYPMIPNQHLYQFPQTPQSQAQAFFFNPPIQLQRPLQSVPATPQNTTQQPPQSMTLPQPQYMHNPGANKKIRREFAIPVIDPDTGKDKLTEVYEEQLEESHSHPPSGESSARETPQPHINSNTKDIQATFAKQVAQAIVEDKVSSVSEEIDQPPHIENIAYPMYPQSTPLTVEYDSIVHSSKLQAATKEFIPSGLAKETTPVVSAITDAEEVTINTSNKQKDRDSPAKVRNKVREQTTSREHKDSVKEALLKDVVNEKPISCKDEFKQKDLNVINVALCGNKDVQISSSPTPALTSTTLRDDKKNLPRKDKVEMKYSSPPSSITASSEDSLSDRALVITPSQLSSEISVTNAKSKSNASQKVKEAQKQPPTQSQLQQQPSAVVPPPTANEKPTPTIPPSQPLKQSNKNNKNRDLNMKGARKEGTDMDAFNDNAALEDTTNANLPSSVNNEHININNTNNVMLNNNSNISTPIINDIKQPESNDIVTISAVSENKNLPKCKTYVIDAIKETSKSIKPTVESEDEPNCTILDNEKLVQVKNEVNKDNNDVETIVRDSKPTLPYRDDQWSPSNPDGKKIYERDFLIALRADPKSKQKPENLPDDIIANEGRERLGDISRFASGPRTTDFTPNFSNNNYSNKNSSQRGVNITKRKSQQGAIGGNNKGSKPNQPRVTISLKEDVKLRESENAWKPARFVASANMTEDEKKTEDLYKKVRGVLNKLTPQKYNTLLEQIKNFSIDTTERLQGVIDLVFEKAVDEPNFSVAYATLCGHLALLQVPTGNINKKDGQEFVNFRKLLITRCQLEFEKNSVDETERNAKIKEMEECLDTEKKKDLMLDLEDYDRRLRMKSVGNIRFIGELYKQNMLTSNIMLRCLTNLLSTNDEESLECLCKLLTTVGKELESKNESLVSLFSTMKDISDKKHGKISSRVRFMIQDVIDLRNSKWVPRRQDLNPKTMDQIQKEAETEQLNIQAMNTVPINTGRRDERGPVGSNMNTNSDKKRRNAGNNDEWCTPSPRGGRQSGSITIKSEKFKHATMNIDEQFGGSHMFQNWGSGSAMKPQKSMGSNTNMYAPLQTLDSDKYLGMRQKEYQVKSSSMERCNRQPSEGPGSRSGSQHRSRDSSATTQRSMPSGVAPSIPKPSPAFTDSPSSIIDPEQLTRKTKNIIEEYLNDLAVRESDEEIKTSIPPEALPQVVYNGYMLVLERSYTARNKTGCLFAYLIKTGTLPLYHYCSGLTNVLIEVEELIIDIPKVWDYVAELLVPVLCENAVTFRDLYSCLISIINKGHAPKVLASLFNLIIKEKGPKFLKSNWDSSIQKFADYMEESKIDSFLTENSFEFMIGHDNSQVNPNHSSLSYEEIHDKLLSFFQEKAEFDHVTNWISANVDKSKMGNQFIRTLTTAILNFAIVNKKFKDEDLVGKYNYFHMFCNSNLQYELQCLYALQNFLYKLEYPQGLLLQIFNKLYEDNVIANDSFITWEECNDQAEQEGKGVALKQLTSFFTQMKEVDEESSEEEEPNSGV